MRESDSNLVWVTPRQAINPMNIVSAFHGRNGELQLTLSAGDQLHIPDVDLTAAGRALLLPPSDATSPRMRPTPVASTVAGISS